jgi:hypothetical protein
MWPIMFAILNYAANFWLQTKTGGTALVLANTDVVALQHSDVANLPDISVNPLAFVLPDERGSGDGFTGGRQRTQFGRLHLRRRVGNHGRWQLVV